MNPVLVQQASRKVENPQVLINMVSRRVRQLNAGGRPMVEPGPRMGLADIALKEVIEGKLGLEAGDGASGSGKG